MGVTLPVASAKPAWPFGELRTFSYDLIVADCPWHFELYSKKGEGKSAQNQYATMTLDDIKALPVGHLAAGDCILFLWATFPLLREAFEVMDAWGFRYSSGGAWHKTTKNGRTAFGTGYRVRSACEPFLIGVCGQPDTSRAERNLIKGEAREHSRKPENAFRWAERYLPGARRVELFSRQSRKGWDTWGLERTKFDDGGDHAAT